MLIAGQNLITFTLITKEEYNLHIRKEKKNIGRSIRQPKPLKKA